MILQLRQYYRAQGILPQDFHCKHYQNCLGDYSKFTKAKATFIGTEYEKGTLPRLLVISLDPGNSQWLKSKRTIRSVRRISQGVDVLSLPKNRHWYRTHELAWILLHKIFENTYGKEINIEKITPYFAHLNTCKCCVNNPSHKQANARLFKNCKEYVPGEIEILNPDIIVTQGRLARKSFEDAFEVVKATKGNIHKYPCSYEILQINWKKVLVFHTHHPTNYGSFNNQRKKCFGKFANVVFNNFMY